MTSHSHRREVVLFLLALILPSAVLVGLGFRMIAQERVAAEARVAADWGATVRQIGQHLLRRLEGIMREELEALASGNMQIRAHRYVNPEVELMATLEDGRLVLPWEENGAEVVRRRLSAGPFASWMRQGERAEFGRRDSRTAIEAYSRALELAQYPAQSGFARLSLARVLAQTGRVEESWQQYRQVLAISRDVTDEHCVPMSLYAAARLLDEQLEQLQVLGQLGEQVTDHVWMAPVTLRMVRALLDTLVETATDSSVRSASRSLRDEVAGVIPATEMASALQRDFPTLGLQYPALSVGAAGSRWISFGNGTWLTSTASSADGSLEVVVAVNAQAVTAPLRNSDVWPAGQTGEVRVRANGEGEGQLLGAALPGLEVVFPSLVGGSDIAALQRTLYAVALLLVVSITFFGAFLVWRDVRRELRLADLRSQFVSSVSHELKTPLTSIRMFAELLQTKDAPDARLRADYLGTIVGESERLTRLLNNVLDLAKIEQDRMTYRPRPTSPSEVVQRAVQAMEYPLEQEGFTLNVDFQVRVPSVPVDPDALEQAILNLLSNAMKYSGESREIDLRVGTEDGHAVIEVTDRGVGIAPEDLDRLTEKFYRVPTPENQQVPGTGLGLTLVDHMAKAHGGDLRIRSVVGAGSTFGVWLPLESEE
jgi:signal transduction histidine kinase